MGNLPSVFRQDRQFEKTENGFGHDFGNHGDAGIVVAVPIESPEQDLAGDAENEDLASLFAVLANEELKHKNGLERIYDDYLAERGD